MLTVKKSQTALVKDGEEGVFSLFAEASSLQIPPGQWPQFIAVVDEKNEGYLFHKSSAVHVGGEVTAVKYLTRAGLLLTVAND